MLCYCRSHAFAINQPLKIPGMPLDSSSCLSGSRERTGERSLQGGFHKRTGGVHIETLGNTGT